MEQSSSSPIASLWNSYGKPSPPGIPDTHLSSIEGSCALCQDFQAARGYKISSVVSGNSTIWDDLRQTGSSPKMCEGCAWGFRSEKARKSVFIVTQDAYLEVTFPEASEFILQPLDRATSMSVPITARKHTLPYMAWGAIATDIQYRLSWGPGEAKMANSLFALRKAGASWASLEQAQPSPGLGLPSGDIFSFWDELRKWKESPHLKFTTSLMRKSGLVAENAT